METEIHYIYRFDLIAEFDLSKSLWELIKAIWSKQVYLLTFERHSVIQPPDSYVQQTKYITLAMLLFKRLSGLQSWINGSEGQWLLPDTWDWQKI